MLDEFEPGKTFLDFQYVESPEFINTFNAGIASDDAASVRMEAPPTTKIMHNKFAVLQGAGDQATVWTGTANIANTCMGMERNTNMSIYVANKEIAHEFQKEFEQMWVYQDQPLQNDNFVPGRAKQPIKMGRFHNDKVPTTRRLFRFADGTDVHLHFSPTDDTEHRVIIPLILGAKPGETLRVSMFAGVGLEFIRAMQVALARGVNIRLLYDRGEGGTPASWLRDPRGGLDDPNPYAKKPPGTFFARFSSWKMNHQKAASLTEANGRVETFVVGSQNWTPPGNDDNDENTLTFHHNTATIPVGAAFNDFFERRMIPKAIPTTAGAGLADTYDGTPPTPPEAAEITQEARPSEVDWSVVE